MQQSTIKAYFRSFSLLEKIIATILFYTIIISGIFIIHNIYLQNTKLINVPGGVYSEGTIGTVDYIDPINARTPIEKEIAHLVFRGLLRYNPLTEDFEPDIARSWLVSDDGLTYTFTLKDSVKFHNDQPITADDIIGTFKLADHKPFTDIKITKISDSEITFTIPQKDAFFLKNFTLGIVPTSLLSTDDPWASLRSESFSRKPIGSGVFSVSEIIKKPQENIIILNSTLKSRTQKLLIHVYQDLDTLKANLKYLNGIRSVPAEIREELITQGWQAHDLYVPRYTVLFFNTNAQGPTSLANFRLALKYAINKEKLVTIVPHTQVMNFPLSSFDSQIISYNKERAASLLFDTGWGVYDGDTKKLRRNKDQTPLVLDLITTEDIDFLRAAKEIKRQFEELGITINTKAMPFEEIQKTVLDTHNYQLLLLGQDIGLDADFRYYLHSTQVNSPGLNISQYKSAEADVILSKIAESSDKTERDDLLKQLKDLINKDIPMVFLFRSFDVYASAPNTFVSFPEKIISEFFL